MSDCKTVSCPEGYYCTTHKCYTKLGVCPWQRLDEIEQQLADMRLVVEEAYFEGRQDMLAITAGGINSYHSWEESSALAALKEQDNE